MAEWDYTTEYCEACVELELPNCSCEPDDDLIECCNCGEEVPSWMGTDICDECQDELDEEDAE